MDDTIIRTAVAGDAGRFIALWGKLQKETEGFLFEAGASQSGEASDNSRPKTGFAHIVFLDDIRNQELAGFAAATRASSSDTTAEIIIAIRRPHTGKGWGKKLLQNMQTWAMADNITQLKLAVSASNHFALKLYQTFGFEVSHTDTSAVQTLHGLDDLHVMIKSLP